MTKIMTPSTSEPITDGQIDKAVATYRAMLCKHRSELGSDAVQYVLGQPEYVAEQVTVLRKRVEAISDMIVRHAVVNRNRTQQEMLDATGREKYTDRRVVDTMPRGEGDEVDVYFFKLGRYISDADLQKEYELRELKPDPYAEGAVNEADLAFADEHPNGCDWKDADGKWCYAAFDQWRDDERFVRVSRRGSGWIGRWWFGGVRNSFHFSPVFAGEFCFKSCPFQPPSILPISSSGAETATYFFVSSDFVSQRIKSNIFNTSSLRIASRTHGGFSVFERKLAVATASINATNSVSIFPPSVYR